MHARVLPLAPVADLSAPLRVTLAALASRLGCVEAAQHLVVATPDALYAAGDAFWGSVRYAAHQPLRRAAAVACWALGDGRVEAAEEALDADAVLSLDPDFVTVCDARRDGWIAAHDAEHAVEEHVLDEEQPRDGDLVDCPACFGTGEGMLGGRCRRCAGQGYRVHRASTDE